MFLQVLLLGTAGEAARHSLSVQRRAPEGRRPIEPHRSRGNEAPRGLSQPRLLGFARSTSKEVGNDPVVSSINDVPMQTMGLISSVTVTPEEDQHIPNFWRSFMDGL